jgi:hypothetical protein
MTERDSAGAVTIQLPPLPLELRAAFVRFYEDAFNSSEPNASGFDGVAFSYFDEKGGDPGSVDQFFNAFTPLWRQFISQERYDSSNSLWRRALDSVNSVEQAGIRIHKGGLRFTSGE